MAHSLEPMQRLGHLGEPVGTLSRWTPGHLTVCTSSAVIAPRGDARTGRASVQPRPCSLHASRSSYHPVPETRSHSGWKLITCEQREVKLPLLVFISDGTEILPTFAHSWAHGELRNRVTVITVSACDVSFMGVSVCSPDFTDRLQAAAMQGLATTTPKPPEGTAESGSAYRGGPCGRHCLEWLVCP